MRKLTACFVVLFAQVTLANAYEVGTHVEISKAAAEASVLQLDPNLSNSLGFKSSDKFRNSENGERTILQLIQDGARFEDGNIRPLFHFFDPLNDTGLSFFTSPTWALEDKDKIHALQNYSLNDAREYLYRALTESKEADRGRYFGKTFESLGRVIHHIQDMAQPQHVRLDAHLNLNWTDEELPFEKRSRYEAYTLEKGGNLPFSSAHYNTGNPVRFDTARSFWHTKFKSPDSGQGMAEFTNHNFVSARTNFDSDRYTSPSRDKAVTHDENANELLTQAGKEIPPACLPPNQPCVMTFYATQVQDNYRRQASAVNPRTSAESIFDQDLRVKGAKPVFSLNRFNFDAAHQFLIPRAVSYSAGLIDHFFRGRLEMKNVEVEDGQIHIEIKNISSEGNSFGPGTLAVYYDSYDGTRKPLTISSGGKLGSGQLAPSDTHSLTVPVPEDLDLIKNSKPFVITFQGRIGEEESVSGLTFEVPGTHTGFLFEIDASQLGDGVGAPRLLFLKDGQWTLHPQGGFAAGSVDWKGWYKNGKPTRILSWKGIRYLPGDGSSLIFQGGKVFSVAPYMVLGAALQKDAAGKTWLIAICEGESKDIVFKRPATPSLSPILYEPERVPDGWQRIAEFQNPSYLEPIRRAWLFNGDGTEAQTMREQKRGYFSQRMPLSRLKMTTDGTSASMADLGNTKVIKTESYDMDATKVTNGKTYDSCDERGSINYKSEVTISGESVAAVDYLNNREILARVRVDSLSTHTESGTANLPYYSASMAGHSATTWLLQIDSITYELVNERSDWTGSESENSGGQQSSYAAESMLERSSVAFMDLRTGALVVRRGHLDQNAKGTSTQRQGSMSRTSASYHDYVIRAERALEHTTSRVDQTNSATGGSWSGALYSAAAWCAGGGGINESHVRRENEMQASPETLERLPIKGGVHGVAAARDRFDNFWVSLKYGDATSNSFQYFNFLTGGDPVAITNPVTGQSTQFLSISPN